MAKKHWHVGAGLCCSGPPNNCHRARLLQADESDFHDAVLIRATDQINEIFKELEEKEPPGRHLRLVDTGLGPFLIYAVEIDRPFVTSESPDEEIRQELGLKREALGRNDESAASDAPSAGA